MAIVVIFKNFKGLKCHGKGDRFVKIDFRGKFLQRDRVCCLARFFYNTYFQECHIIRVTLELGAKIVKK